MSIDSRPSVPTLEVSWASGHLLASGEASPVQVGRANDPVVQVQVEGGAVSRRHLRFVVEDGAWVAIDQSKRGTYGPGGRRLERVAIGPDPMPLRLSAPDGPEIRARTTTEPVSQKMPLGAPSAGEHLEAGRGPAKRWSLRSVLVLVIGAVVGAAAAWAGNVWLIARHYDGVNNLPSDAPVAMRPDWGTSPIRMEPNLQGLLFLFLLAAISSAIATQLVVLGPRSFFRKVVALPTQLRSIPTRAGQRWALHAMSGAAVALVVGVLFIPATRATAGLGLMLFLPSGLGQAMSAVLGRVAVAVVGSTPRSVANLEAYAGTWLLGAGMGLVAGAVVAPIWARLLIAAALLVAVFVGRASGPRATMALLVVALVGTVVVFDWLTASPALADDGGWTECQPDDWNEYWELCGSDLFHDSWSFGTLLWVLGWVLGWWSGGRTPRSDYEIPGTGPGPHSDGPPLNWREDLEGGGHIEGRATGHVNRWEVKFYNSDDELEWVWIVDKHGKVVAQGTSI